MFLWLQVQNLANTILCENVMVASDPFDKAKLLQKVAQRIELNVLVRRSTENPVEEFGLRRHSDNVTQETLSVHASAQSLTMNRKRRSGYRKVRRNHGAPIVGSIAVILIEASKRAQDKPFVRVLKSSIQR